MYIPVCEWQCVIQACVLIFWLDVYSGDTVVIFLFFLRDGDS